MPHTVTLKPTLGVAEMARLVADGECERAHTQRQRRLQCRVAQSAPVEHNNKHNLRKHNELVRNAQRRKHRGEGSRHSDTRGRNNEWRKSMQCSQVTAQSKLDWERRVRKHAEEVRILKHARVAATGSDDDKKTAKQ